MQLLGIDFAMQLVFNVLNLKDLFYVQLIYF